MMQDPPGQQSAFVVQAPSTGTHLPAPQTKGGTPVEPTTKAGFGTQGRPQQSALVAQACPDLEPASVQLSSLTKSGASVTCRVFNASDEAVDARIHVAETWADMPARLVELLGEESETLLTNDGVIALKLRPWEIASIKLG